MNENKKSYINIISGILFALIGIISIFNFAYSVFNIVQNIEMYGFGSIFIINLLGLFNQMFIIIGCGITAAVFLMGKRNIFGTAGLIGFTVSNIFSFILTIYQVIAYIRYIGVDISVLLNFLIYMLNIISMVAALVIAFICITDFMPKWRKVAKKLWFLPAIILLLPLIIGTTESIIDISKYGIRINIVAFVRICIDFLIDFLKSAAVLTACFWFAYPNDMQTKRAFSSTVQNTEVHQTKFDTADELKKSENLLDCGAITQEEFDVKKKQ